MAAVTDRDRAVATATIDRYFISQCRPFPFNWEKGEGEKECPPPTIVVAHHVVDVAGFQFAAFSGKSGRRNLPPAESCPNFPS